MRSSVIIPLYHGRRWIPACLDALRRAGPDEIIVVDDGSPDGGADWVADNAPDVRLLRSAGGQGFAAACNLGLRHATGDLLVLLNQDTEVEPGWLTPLAAALADPGIAFAGSRAAYPDGRIQHAGGWISERGEAGHYHDERAAGDVPFVTGASIALRRPTLERIGALDESFAPAYFEDVEWCLRARAAGLRVWYEPTSRLTHFEESRVAQADDHETMVAYHRNRLRVVIAQWPAPRFVDQFIPAERAWLADLDAEGAEQLVAAMHRVYLYHLIRLHQARGRDDAIEGVARGLLALLSVVPLNGSATVPLMDTVPTPVPSDGDADSHGHDDIGSDAADDAASAGQPVPASATGHAPALDPGWAPPPGRIASLLRPLFAYLYWVLLRGPLQTLAQRQSESNHAMLSLIQQQQAALDQQQAALDQQQAALDQQQQALIHAQIRHERLTLQVAAYLQAINANLGELAWPSHGALDSSLPEHRPE